VVNQIAAHDVDLRLTSVDTQKRPLMYT